MGKIPVEYSANNSGGSDWLTPKDWAALRKAGWLVHGFDNAVYDADGNYEVDEEGLPKTKGKIPAQGQYAYKRFNNIQEALAEFEKLTSQDVSAEGCNCCGPPHSFTWGKDIIVRLPQDQLDKQDYHYASGEDLLDYMYPAKPTQLSKRELLERL